MKATPRSEPTVEKWRSTFGVCLSKHGVAFARIFDKAVAGARQRCRLCRRSGVGLPRSGDPTAPVGETLLRTYMNIGYFIQFEIQTRRELPMVDAITAVSASSATTATRVETSLSITSEPDNKWVAERQSKIDADQVALKNAMQGSDQNDVQHDVEEQPIPLFEGHAHNRKNAYQRADRRPSEDEGNEPLLSGESERIGSTNFDDETPFGGRVAII